LSHGLASQHLKATQYR